jgi:hypothetical protein
LFGEISQMTPNINILAPKPGSKEIKQLSLDIAKVTEVGGIGMGVLSDGTPYLNQRGLATLCGVQNAYIGTISSQWFDVEQKPRVISIKSILEKSGSTASRPHLEVLYKGQMHYCYPSDVCLSILEYYAFDAGTNCQPQARDNFRILAGSKLRDLIYSQVGYDPTGAKANKFDKWHERIALNYQSAPKGYFHVFNEVHTIIYELIMAGAEIGEKFVVDVSIGQHWSKYWSDSSLAEEHKYWSDSSLAEEHGDRDKYPHRYPASHPQAKSNPQDSWCYPLGALGHFRQWLQSVYLEGGKFHTYLQGKVASGQLPPSVAQLAIVTLTPTTTCRPLTAFICAS